MAEKKKMSVAEILAAARKSDGQGGGGPAETSAPEPAAETAETAPAHEPEVVAEDSAAPEPEAKPAKPKPAASGGRPSVADILAAARANKGADKPAPKAAPKAAAPKPAVKPAAKAAEKPAEKPAKAPAGANGAKDTASILAAARKAAKPGPMSKAEAAAKLKPAEPPAAKAKPTAPPMPPKPEYAKPKPAKQAAAETEERRGFMFFALGSFLALGFTSVAATVSLWTLGLARFMFPNVLIEPPSKFKVGFPADYAPGSVEEKFKAQFGVWVCKAEYQGQMQVYALRTVCTHLGCTPNWLEAEQKFKCPCHGSGFYKDGINFEGPAPRPLERYAIRVADDGQLEIDKSKMFQEEMGQWKDPASFVPA